MSDVYFTLKLITSGRRRHFSLCVCVCLSVWTLILWLLFILFFFLINIIKHSPSVSFHVLCLVVTQSVFYKAKEREEAVQIYINIIIIITIIIEYVCQVTCCVCVLTAGWDEMHIYINLFSFTSDEAGRTQKIVNG